MVGLGPESSGLTGTLCGSYQIVRETERMRKLYETNIAKAWSSELPSDD